MNCAVISGNPSQYTGLVHAAVPEHAVVAGGSFGACGGGDALPTRPVQVHGWSVFVRVCVCSYGCVCVFSQVRECIVFILFLPCTCTSAHLQIFPQCGHRGRQRWRSTTPIPPLCHMLAFRICVLLALLAWFLVPLLAWGCQGFLV